MTRVEQGDSDLIRSSFKGSITDVGFRTFDSSGQVTANKVVTMSFYDYDERCPLIITKLKILSFCPISPLAYFFD